MKNLSSNHPQIFTRNAEASTLIKIRGAYSTLKKAEQPIANTIFQNPEKVIKLSITLLILDVLYVSVALRRYEACLHNVERTKESLGDKKY